MTNKFKVGDKVVHKVYGSGEVVEVEEFLCMSDTVNVMFDKTHEHLHDGCREGHSDAPGYHYFFSEEHRNLEELTLVEPKFKIGDIVEYIALTYKGRKGVITEIDNTIHSCNKVVFDDGYEWWSMPQHLKLLTEQKQLFKVGDKVLHKTYGQGVVEKDDTSRDGTIGVRFKAGIGWFGGDLLDLSELAKVGKEENVVYVVLKCSGSAWPQQERIYDILYSKQEAEKLQEDVQKRHPNDHIALLTWTVK